MSVMASVFLKFGLGFKYQRKYKLARFLQTLSLVHKGMGRGGGEKKWNCEVTYSSG